MEAQTLPGTDLSDTAAEAPSESATAPEAVVVRFGGARYAVPMGDVAEVVTVPVVTRVPGSPAWLTGVVNWRGRVLAVVDLRPVVGDEMIPLPSSARLVVLSAGGAEAGLLVEGVTGLLTPGRPVPTATPPTVSAAVADLVAGVVDDAGPVSLLDAAAVLRLRRGLPDGRPVS